MPDGTAGRGFLNGSLTWSFLGDDVNAISDDDLLVAYCGWAWLFPALQAGNVATEFPPLTEEADFRAKKQNDGLKDLELTGRYKIGTSELFEFKATKGGKADQGCGRHGVRGQLRAGRSAIQSAEYLLPPGPDLHQVDSVSGLTRSWPRRGSTVARSRTRRRQTAPQ